MNEFFIFLGHHWELTVLLIIIMLAIFVIESITQGFSSDGLDSQKVVQLMNQKSAVIIDIREKDIFSQGYIIGSINISLNDIENHVKKLQKYKEKSIVVVSDDAGKMMKARNFLVKQKFSDVKVLKGGITAWKNAALPLEKTLGEQKNDK